MRERINGPSLNVDPVAASVRGLRCAVTGVTGIRIDPRDGSRLEQRAQLAGIAPQTEALDLGQQFSDEYLQRGTVAGPMEGSGQKDLLLDPQAGAWQSGVEREDEDRLASTAKRSKA